MALQSDDDSPMGVRVRLEQYLSNPACETNRHSALFNVNISQVVKYLRNSSQIKSWIEPNSTGISEIASKSGQQFEASLFANNCELVLQIASKLAVTANQVNDDFRFIDGKKFEDHIRDRISASKSLIADLVAKKDVGLWIINGFALPVEMLGEETHLEIDIVLASRKKSGVLEISLGEVKVYPYKAGRTNSHQLETARAQLGLYHHIMRGLISDHELDGSVILRNDGFLVLQNLATGQPFVEDWEDLTFLSERARQAVSLVSDPTINLHLRPDKALAKVADSKHRFQESCWVQCELAQHCHTELIQQDNPLVLGESAHGILGNGAVHIQAAIDLVDYDASDAVLTNLESDLKQRFLESSFKEIENSTWR